VKYRSTNNNSRLEKEEKTRTKNEMKLKRLEARRSWEGIRVMEDNATYLAFTRRLASF
jgi:hypothetical protein